MELAEVIGTVVCSVKYDGLTGVRLLVIQPKSANGENQGEPLVCADAMQAGIGDTISWIGGREATLTLPENFVPVDAAVVSIVDHSWSTAQDGSTK